MTKPIRLFCIVTLFALALNACTTYYIPVDSFKQQFAGVDSSSLREVTTRGPAGDRVTYKTYPIDFIKCVDDKGNHFELPNSPSIEIRFTQLDGKRTIFYFDLLRVTDTTIAGRQSRFISSFRKTIPISQIKKIEVQDGRKNFHYVK